jgi:hypothetical protein
VLCRLVFLGMVLMIAGSSLMVPCATSSAIEPAGTPLRAGIIGLDTSHVTVFTRLMPMALAISRSIIPTFSGTGSTGSRRSTPSCYLSIPDIATKRPGPGCLAGPRKGRYTPMNMPVSRGMFRLMPHVSRIRHGASRCLVPPSGLSLC